MSRCRPCHDSSCGWGPCSCSCHEDESQQPREPDAVEQLDALLKQAGTHPYYRADLERAMKAEAERDKLYWAMFCAPFEAAAWTTAVMSIWEQHASDMATAASTHGDLLLMLTHGLKTLIDGAEARDGHMTIKSRAVNRLINRLGLR